ncbi:MAG: 2-hydroxyglutaryl-CoA dehydratase [Candidatus Omnitrophica bacterium]|nr:2-hydroxyglutaryl-CoA dehydratase [Candidatus Omnitrophota bacterium]
MLYAGIDAGSRTIKVVLIDAGDRHVVATGLCSQGVRQAVLAQDLFDKVLLDAGFKKKDIVKTVATGYGRNVLDWADTTVTEITCQAYGVKHQVPQVRMVIDIGGEDSKVIRLDKNGIVHDFAMNDRCAAGTGRFLEVVADRLEMPLKDLGKIAQEADHPAIISSMCVVFAETEIVGLLATETSSANIVAGVQNSIAKRIVSMVGGRVDGPVVFTGGVALIPGMRIALARELKCDLSIAHDPQMTAAFGAAIIAAGHKNEIYGAREHCLEMVR